MRSLEIFGDLSAESYSSPSSTFWFHLPRCHVAISEHCKSEGILYGSRTFTTRSRFSLLHLYPMATMKCILRYCPRKSQDSQITSISVKAAKVDNRATASIMTSRRPADRSRNSKSRIEWLRFEQPRPPFSCLHRSIRPPGSQRELPRRRVPFNSRAFPLLLGFIHRDMVTTLSDGKCLSVRSKSLQLNYELILD